MTNPATIDIQDGVATITLDDGKANAFGFAMLDALDACLTEAIEGSEVIVLTGRPGIMCAGFDLKVMREAPDQAGDMVRKGGEFLLRLFSAPQPVLIASTGHGIAAGGLLMLAADYRIGVAGATRYGLNESAIGMVLPPYGMSLARFKLDNRALDKAVVGAELFLPEQANDVGYLDEVVAEADFAARVAEKVAYFKELDSAAYAGNKKYIRGALIKEIRADLDAGLGMNVSA